MVSPRVEASVNLAASRNPTLYFMSIDLAMPRHPQTRLATYFNVQPLTVDHGAPLRLLAFVKLGFNNASSNYRFPGVKFAADSLRQPGGTDSCLPVDTVG